MAEPTTIEGVVKALVAAIEARESAEPDLPVWETDARLRSAEAELLRVYRESSSRGIVAFDVVRGSRMGRLRLEEEIISVEVA